MSSPVKTLIFDLGVVVLGWHPGEAFQRFMPHRVHNPQQGWAFAQALFLTPAWKAFDQGLADEEQLNRRLVAEEGFVAEELQGIHAFVRHELAPAADTVGLIERYAAQRDAGAPIRLLFLSNMPHSYAREIEAMHPFMRRFCGGLFSSDVKEIKPEPEIYTRLQATHGFEPAQTLFIDDHAPNLDVPRGLGWQVLHFADRAASVAEIEAFMAR